MTNSIHADPDIHMLLSEGANTFSEGEAGFYSFKSKTMGCDGAMKGSHVAVVVLAAVWYTFNGRTPSLFVCWLFISTEVQWTV